MGNYATSLNDGIIDSVKSGAMNMFQNVIGGGNIEQAGSEALERINTDMYEEASNYVNSFDAEDALDVANQVVTDAVQKANNGNGGINPSSNDGFNAKPDVASDLDVGGFLKRNLQIRPVPVVAGVAVGGFTYHKTKSIARSAIFGALAFMGANFVQDRIKA